MFDRMDGTETHNRAMNKSQKASTKVKRDKQRNTTNTPDTTNGTHQAVRQTHVQTRQDLLEAEMEKSRKAVENKLIYLSGATQAVSPSRPAKRAAKAGGTAAGAGVAAAPGTGRVRGAGGGGSAHRRKQSKKQESAKKPQEDEKPESVEDRKRGQYNVFLESPRRNGLSPRDFEAEAELAALLAAAHHSGAGESKSKLGSRKQGKDGDPDADDAGMPLSTYGHMRVEPRYKCNECGARFHVRALLVAHRRTHADDFKVRYCGRCPKDSNTTLTAGNQCKFCDRKFDLVRTLHIHQLSHCKKIPPQLRRKLVYTELAHEKKAPLPNFQRSAHHSPHSHHSYLSHYSHRSQRHQKRERERERESMKSLLASDGHMMHPLLQQSEELTKTILRSSVQHERWR